MTIAEQLAAKGITEPKANGSAVSVAAPVTQAQPSIADLLKRIAELEAQSKRQSTMRLSIRVSEKGAVSVYGLQRFPVSLYKEQMLRLLDAGDDIRAFIKANDSSLKAKGQTVNA